MGKNNDKPLNDIVIYDCFCRIVKASSIKLKKECCFINKTGIKTNKNQFFFIDDDCNVHLINTATKNAEIKYLHEESII